MADAVKKTDAPKAEAPAPAPEPVSASMSVAPPEAVPTVVVEALRGYWPKTWTGSPEIARRKWAVGDIFELPEDEFEERAHVKPPIFAPATKRQLAAFKALRGL